MDQDSLRAISTLLIFLAFIGLTISVYRKRSSDYDEAANLPFSDDKGRDRNYAQNGDRND